LTKDVFQVENEQTNLKNRSKSELDLSIKSTSSSKSNKSKENITKNTSMFAFFSRKKNSDTLKSRTSLNVISNNEYTSNSNSKISSDSTKSPSIASSHQIKSAALKLDQAHVENTTVTAANEYYSPTNIKSQAKKRPAPAPPVLTQLKDENNQTEKIAIVDPVLVEKFFTKKKNKAPPPPPLATAVTPQVNLESLSNQTASSPTHSNSTTYPASNSESTPNFMRNGNSKKELSLSISTNSSPQPSISSASASPSLSESHSSGSNQSPKERIERLIELNNNSLIIPADNSSNNKETPSMLNSQINRNSSIKSNSIYSEQHNIDDDSISTIETLRQKKQSSFKTLG
jgi:hypothetical protein